MFLGFNKAVRKEFHPPLELLVSRFETNSFAA